MEQRAETYREYVSDSLFFLQHLMTGGNEEKRLFAVRYSDIMKREDAADDDLDANEIIERMRNKARSKE